MQINIMNLEKHMKSSWEISKNNQLRKEKKIVMNCKHITKDMKTMMNI